MKKKILNISTMDIGGAGSSAYRFHKQFKENGQESVLLVLKKYSKDKDVIGFRNLSTFFRRFLYKFFKNKSSNPFFNSALKYHFINPNETQTVINTKKILSKVPFKPDVIFIYWVSNFINAQNIRELNEITGAPVFWFLTDMAPLTGGCHYAWECFGYTMECKNCPALENENFENQQIANKNLEFKKQHLLKGSLSFIIATTKLEKQFLQSQFKNFKYQKIFSSINTEIFYTINKTLAKAHFSIGENKKVIFIGCSDFNDERKGMIYLKKALLILITEFHYGVNDILLLIAGKNVEKFIIDLPFKYLYLEVIKTDKELCYAYSAAEVFACPSIEDSGPMMINESILCGTPVVAFEDVGVADDLIKTTETGYIAIKKDEKDFSKGINYILELKDIEYKKMVIKCREIGLYFSNSSNKIDELIDNIY